MDHETEAKLRSRFGLLRNEWNGPLAGAYCSILLGSILFITVAQANTGAMKFRVLAGGKTGYQDGPSIRARFNQPTGIALRSDGTAFIADTGNNSIRSVSTSGTVITVAGNKQGYQDGPVHSARFRDPQGIAVSVTGDVFVADTANHCIRKISRKRYVSTIAGRFKLDKNSRPVGGYVDGIGTAAEFKFPMGITVSPAGDIYVADTGNNCIRHISSSGHVTTLAGHGVPGLQDGISKKAMFTGPTAISLASNGMLFIGDTDNNRIRLVSRTGVVTTIAGSGIERGSMDGRAHLASFSLIRSLSSDEGQNLYIADYGNFSIRMLSSDGMVRTLFDSAQPDGTHTLHPAGIAIDRHHQLYITDMLRNVVLVGSF